MCIISVDGDCDGEGVCIRKPSQKLDGLAPEIENVSRGFETKRVDSPISTGGGPSESMSICWSNCRLVTSGEESLAGEPWLEADENLTITFCCDPSSNSVSERSKLRVDSELLLDRRLSAFSCFSALFLPFLGG
jgi:hypothetical protein